MRYAAVRCQPQQHVVNAFAERDGVTDGFAMGYDAVYRFQAAHTVNETMPAGCRI